jgi:hypothetical protein
MITPDGWQVELVRFGAEPAFRVRCGPARGPGTGVVVGLAGLVSVLGDSFELLERRARPADVDAGALVPADA